MRIERDWKDGARARSGTMPLAAECNGLECGVVDARVEGLRAVVLIVTRCLEFQVAANSSDLFLDDDDPGGSTLFIVALF